MTPDLTPQAPVPMTTESIAFLGTDPTALILRDTDS